MLLSLSVYYLFLSVWFRMRAFNKAPGQASPNRISVSRMVFATCFQIFYKADDNFKSTW